MESRRKGRACEILFHMSILGLTPEEIAERARSSAKPPLTLERSLAYGALGFGVAGAVVFAAVGCGRPWMFDAFGAVGPYLVAAALFVLLGGATLGKLVIGPGRVGRFFALFGTAFFAYAALWTAAYFAVGGMAGELAGGLAGTPAAALVIVWAFGARKQGLRIILWLTLASCAGYFLGRVPYALVGGQVGMILFGALFGAVFGLGLGYVLHLAQAKARALLGPPAR